LTIVRFDVEKKNANGEGAPRGKMFFCNDDVAGKTDGCTKKRVRKRTAEMVVAGAYDNNNNYCTRDDRWVCARSLSHSETRD
jgi:hypothetical protein